MPDVEWVLLCDYCLIDQGGRLSLLGIFERLLTPTLPVQHPLFYVVTRWRAQPQQGFTAETRIWTPTEQLLITTGPVQVAPSPTEHNLTINQFRGLTFDREGQYLVELLADDDTTRCYPCQVSLQRGPS